MSDYKDKWNANRNVESIDRLELELGRTKKALGYAILVIENYAMDIRSREDLKGFCDGEIYRDAVNDIRNIASGKLKI